MVSLLGFLQGFCCCLAYRGLPVELFRWIIVWHPRKIKLGFIKGFLLLLGFIGLMQLHISSC
jgi:hypothetical protein